MRHDPACAAVMVMLRSLKMYGMAGAVGAMNRAGIPLGMRFLIQNPC